MPADPPSNTGSPDRSRPPASDPSKESSTEADLWNLDDDVIERAAARPSLPRAQSKPDREPAEGDPQKRQKRGMTPNHPEKRKPNLAKSEAPTPVHSDEIGFLDELRENPEQEEVRLVVIPEDEEDELPPPALETAGDTARDSDSSSAPRQNRPRPEAAAPAAAAGSFRFSRPSARELLGIAAVVFIMMLGGIWVLSRFFSQLSFQAEYVKPPKLPVKGQLATISALGTYWREPVREGPNADRAKREAVMIPALELTLDPASTSGALRIVFRNEKGATTGDTLIRGFQGGRFTDNGETKITIAASDGFSKDGDYNAYRTSGAAPWTVEVKEGASREGDSTTFQPLLISPIQPLRR